MTDASASKCPATSYSLYTVKTGSNFYFMRGKYKVNHQILARLDQGGQVLLLNKDRLSTLFKLFSFDWKGLKLLYSIFL